MLPKKLYFVLISLSALTAYILLFIFRGADDNTLTSWQWTFRYADERLIFLMLSLGIVLAYTISRTDFNLSRKGIILVVLSFGVSVIFWGEPEVIVDSSRYFTQAKHLEVYGISYFFNEWGRAIGAWTDLPLLPFLYGLIFRVFGESRIFIQVFNSVIFSVSTFLTYKIGKTLWDEETGFFGGLFLLGVPYMLVQVPLMLVDIPTMFFIVLSVFTFIKAIREGGPKLIALCSLAVFLAVFAKYSTWLMLSVLVPVFLVHIKTDKAVQRGALILAITGLLAGLFFFIKFDVFSEQIKLLLAYQKPALKGWQEGYISTFLFQTHPFITVLAFCSTFIAIARRDLRFLIVFWLVFLIFVLQIKRIRYIIMVFPMLALMASYGLNAIRDREIRMFIASCAVISSILIASSAYLPFLNKISTVNMKDAGRFLNSLDIEAVEVLTLPQRDSMANTAVSVPMLDIYTDKNIVYEYNSMPAPKPVETDKSPLRFTWEFKNPAYYMDGQKKRRKAIVIISSDPLERLPDYIRHKTEGLGNSKVFGITEDVFRFRTVLTVYYGQG